MRVIQRKLKCHECGNIIDSIPLSCGHNMVYNEEKKQFECFLGPGCGYIALDELICGVCAQKC